MKMAGFQVSKLDAARRQLETAVRLYFAEADPVSIHTLTAAAYQVLSDINRARGGSPMLKEQAPTWVQADLQDAARRRLNEAQNFFKHADKDHEGTLTFNPRPTELMIFDACEKYKEMTGEAVPVFGVYHAWSWFGPGAGLVKGDERERLVESLRRAFPGTSRGSFFREVLPMVSSLDS